MMKRSYSVALVVLGVTGVLLFVATCSFSPILQSIVQLKMRQVSAYISEGPQMGCAAWLVVSIQLLLLLLGPLM